MEAGGSGNVRPGRPGSAHPSRRPQVHHSAPPAAGSVASPQSAAGIVEARFYGDGTWNKAILGAQQGPDRQLVMFVGYEGDGWQDTAAKDIRYPVKIGGGHASGGGQAAAADDSGQGTPTKTGQGKSGKGGRSGKKWEVVSGFMDQATTGGKAAKAKDAAGPGKKKQAASAPPPAAAAARNAGEALQHSSAKQPPPSSSAPASATATPGSPSKASGVGPAAAPAPVSGAAQEAKEAVAAAAAALSSKAEAEEDGEGGSLGVSYDLLTAVTERLDDVALFEPSQIDEEGLTAVLTTADGALRFLEMCRRLMERISNLEGKPRAPAASRADIQGFLAERGWVMVGPHCLLTPKGRFAALEFLTADLQSTQMLAAAGKLACAAPLGTGGAMATCGSKAQPPTAAPPEQTRAPELDKSETGVAGVALLAEEDEEEQGRKPSEVRVLRYLRSLLASSSVGAIDDGRANVTPGGRWSGSRVVAHAGAYASDVLKELPRRYLGEPVLASGVLSEEHVQVLAEVSQEMRVEYSMRRQMLLQRIGVVAASFAYSSTKHEGHKEMFATTAKREIERLVAEPSYSIYDLLCAKGDVGELVYPSRYIGSAIKQVSIGRVPDRGGRVEDLSGRDMLNEVRRANDAMRGKDATRGGRGGAGGGGRGVQVASGQYHPEYARNARGGGGARGGGRGRGGRGR